MVRYSTIIFLLLPLVTFGQEWDFGPLRRLPSTINSQYEDILPMQTPDGKLLFFARAASPENAGGKFAGTDVWISKLNENTNTWGTPENAKVFNDKGTDAVVGINEKGDEVFLLKTTGTKRAEGIYHSKKTGDSWSEPRLINIPGLSTEDFLGAYVSPDMKVIIFSMNGEESRGNEDLYISLRNTRGEWSKPRNLGSTINTSGFEMAPFLSPDKRRLYFASDGHPGYGSSDIFYSDRLYESWEVWSAPKNLGVKVNSPAFESYFSIYHDSVAFFSSTRNKGLSDIYKVAVFPVKEETEEEIYRYLSDEEIRKITGPSFEPVLYFDKGASDLTREHEANLQRVNNNFAARKDIKLRLIALRSGNASLDSYQKRLLNILEYLKDAGIEGNRIIFAVEQAETAAASKELVRIRFYR